MASKDHRGELGDIGRPSLWLYLSGLAGLLGYLVQSYDWQPENFGIFLFDYQLAFLRRGLLGQLASYFPVEPAHLFKAWYWISLLLLYGFVLLALRRALFIANQEVTWSKLLYCMAILCSPLFLKNLIFDFGRVDTIGFMTLFGFLLAPLLLQRVLVLLLPPFLILCHEAQVILTVGPMICIFLISSCCAEKRLSLATLALAIIASFGAIGLCAFLLTPGDPGVDIAILREHILGKTAHPQVNDRTWLLYYGLEENMAFARDGGGHFANTQLYSSPIYLLAFLLHLPVTRFFWQLLWDRQRAGLRLAAGLVLLTMLAQCSIFFLALDYARWIADIFIGFVAMLLVLVAKFDLASRLDRHARHHWQALLAVLFIFLALPKFGVVSP